MSKPPNAQLSHLGFFVRDLDAMVEFYTRVLGLVVSDSGPYSRGGRIAFLTRSPTEHHQVIFAEGRTPEMGAGLINQISFRLDSLEDLRWYDRSLREQAVPIDRTLNHGNAWSIYLFDPEGNRIELYATAPWYVSQPFGEPLDLGESADVIMAKTEAMIRNDPTYRPIAAWSDSIRAKMAEGS